MGFFSWMTQDTNESIANKWQEARPTFPVIMADDKGNIWQEDNYDGYGVFGGKDYYQLVAEMNGKATGNLEKDRWEGVNLEMGVNGIQHKETKQVYKGQRVDFFNWEYDILPHGMSANASLASGEWESITVFEEDVLLPSLSRAKLDKNGKAVDDLTAMVHWGDGKYYDGEGPKSCPDQGFFYGDVMDDIFAPI